MGSHAVAVSVRVFLIKKPYSSNNVIYLTTDALPPGELHTARLEGWKEC